MKARQRSRLKRLNMRQKRKNEKRNEIKKIREKER